MKLSTKGRYAVAAMVDLAQSFNRKQPVSLVSIALRNNISASYLEQLFIKLKKAELIESSRGSKGGYKLSKKPEEIYISDIINSVDEKIDILSCNKEGKNSCLREGKYCGSHNLWNNLLGHIDEYLSAVSLRNVIENKFN